jgi:hypothetical protein
VQRIEKSINFAMDFQRWSGYNAQLANPNDMIQRQECNKYIPTLEIDPIDDRIILGELIRKRSEHRYFKLSKF